MPKVAHPISRSAAFAGHVPGPSAKAGLSSSLLPASVVHAVLGVRLVTRTSAVPELAYSSVLMFTRFVVIGMTARTIGDIGRESPGHHLGILQVTSCAWGIHTMIAWIGGRLMSEYERRPVVGHVTVVAFLVGYEMIVVFSGGNGAVVAARAGAIGIGVVELRRQPGHGDVAHVAFIGCGNVVCGLARGDCAVVTA